MLIVGIIFKLFGYKWKQTRRNRERKKSKKNTKENDAFVECNDSLDMNKMQRPAHA